MKKVCFLIGNLSNSGGTERVTSLIANELVKQRDYDISILSLVDGKKPFFDLDSNIKIYSLYDKKISFKSNFFKTVWKIRKFVQEYKINNLIVVDSISCIFTIPALLGVKVNHICWEHFNFKNNNGVKLRDISRMLAAKYCDFIVTLTERDKNIWFQNLKKINANIINIPNPCPFISQNNSKVKNKKTVLAVGRLTHVKGFDMLLEAWINVIKVMPEWKLKIVGDGEEKKKLLNFINNNNLIDHVELIGNTNYINKYYEEADIFCLSSHFEGFPMVLLEAQSYALPIVSFDCDTGPAEIIENHVNGILVNSGSVNQLSIALLEVINLSDIEYEKMSKNALKSSVRYTINSVINQWLNVIK
ncbi:glycosyltransferase family 4 protein [Acinetobacter johnsonii]|uniref:glycosyltransferase family 4 protein n=1 Tax=Acinetobacter johnsonii TaxID=40214 RepID=UPI0032B4D40F